MSVFGPICDCQRSSDISTDWNIMQVILGCLWVTRQIKKENINIAFPIFLQCLTCVIYDY